MVKTVFREVRPWERKKFSRLVRDARFPSEKSVRIGEERRIILNALGHSVLPLEGTHVFVAEETGLFFSRKPIAFSTVVFKGVGAEAEHGAILRVAKPADSGTAFSLFVHCVKSALNLGARSVRGSFSGKGSSRWFTSDADPFLPHGLERELYSTARGGAIGRFRIFPRGAKEEG